MFKKIFVLGGGATLVAFLLFGTSAFSHIEHGVSWIQGKVHDSVPVEYELERARELIEKTGPEMRKVRKVIAEKQVEMKYLDRDIKNIETAQVQNKAALKHQAARLSEGKTHYTLSRGRVVSRALYEHDASRRLDKVRTRDNILSSKREHFQALQKTLMSAERRLEELKAQREKLIAKVATIEAKLQEAKAKKALTLDVEVDTSNLAKASGILTDLNKRLDVELRVMENNQPLLDETDFDDIEATSIQDRISAYFETPDTTNETLVVTDCEASTSECSELNSLVSIGGNK